MKIEAVLSANTLIVEGAQVEQANKIIDGFFAVLGTAPKKEETSKVLPKTQKTLSESEKTLPNPPKVLPKVNAERTLNTPIAELLKEKVVQSSNIRPLEDGTKLYQSQYDCDCGHSGRRYIRETNDYLKCHQCGEKLLVEAATLAEDKDGLPMPDVDGNFFIAREKFENKGS